MRYIVSGARIALDIYPDISCIRECNRFHVMRTKKDHESTPGKHNARENLKKRRFTLQVISSNIMECASIDGCTVGLRGTAKLSIVVQENRAIQFSLSLSLLHTHVVLTMTNEKVGTNRRLVFERTNVINR